MESAEQPSNNLHRKVGESLKKLGHHEPTIPPNEGPVLAEDLKDMVEDLGYTAKTALEQAVRGGVTHVRITESKNPLSILKRRLKWK